jgi:hypothetical protein
LKPSLLHRRKRLSFAHKNLKARIERCFSGFFAISAQCLWGNFKTGDRKTDAENEDGNGERFRLRWLLQRSLFAAYETMEVLGVKPKRSAIDEFNEELVK